MLDVAAVLALAALPAALHLAPGGRRLPLVAAALALVALALDAGLAASLALGGALAACLGLGPGGRAAPRPVAGAAAVAPGVALVAHALRAPTDPVTALIALALLPAALEAAVRPEGSAASAARRLACGVAGLALAASPADPLLHVAAALALGLDALRAGRGRRAMFAAALGLLLALPAAEVALRARGATFAWESASGPLLDVDDPAVGLWRRAAASVRHVKPCFDVVYRTNAWGMRDRERDEVRTGPRLAVLGDSFVEGFGVGDEETFPRRLEALLPGVEALNFGVRGFGLTQSWLLYGARVRRFAPDVVIVCFTPGNDPLDDGFTVSTDLLPDRWRPYLVDGALRWPARRLTRRGHDGPLTTALAPHGRALQALLALRTRLSLPPRGTFDPRHVYLREPAGAWREGWAAEAEALRRLKEETARDGARLVVAVLPDPLQLDPDWRAKLSRDDPAVDALAPSRRVEELARALGLPCLALLPATERACAARGVTRWPYLSMSGDPHWSPLGHEVVAEVLADALRREGLVPR